MLEYWENHHKDFDKKYSLVGEVYGSSGYRSDEFKCEIKNDGSYVIVAYSAYMLVDLKLYYVVGHHPLRPYFGYVLSFGFALCVASIFAFIQLLARAETKRR